MSQPQNNPRYTAFQAVVAIHCASHISQLDFFEQGIPRFEDTEQ
jgi:hypothetical protein